MSRNAEESSIYIVRQNKDGLPSLMWVDSIQFSEVLSRWIRQETYFWGGAPIFFLLPSDVGSNSWSWIFFLPVLRSSDSDWIISLGSLLLQLTQSRWENGPPHSWKPILCMFVPVGVYKGCLYCYTFILQPNTEHTYSLQGRALSFLYLHRLLHLNWECWGIGDQSAAMATKWGPRGNQVRGTLVNSVCH